MLMTIPALLLLLAVVCFFLAVIRAAQTVNTVALGLFFWALSQLWIVLR